MTDALDLVTLLSGPRSTKPPLAAVLESEGDELAKARLRRAAALLGDEALPDQATEARVWGDAPQPGAVGVRWSDAAEEAEAVQ